MQGLGFGADDYLTKPFHKDELIARINAILRRSAARTDNIVRCGDLTIDLGAQHAHLANKQVPLTNKEFQMLELLAVRVGSTITKEMFLTFLRAYEVPDPENAPDEQDAKRDPVVTLH